jgi:hypothetical protein
MIAFLRLAVVGFVIATVFYVLLSIYARSLRRERLEKEWEAKGRPGSRADYVRAGMAAYNASLRPRLILGVYVVPALVVGIILYLTNYHP